ncbi:MAG TPA: hypothetical protein P5567_08230 [Kiritimatiellia bacterium]|nr:hypothetical protein [Kiritimatiellia bacterium]HRZ12428.1 hypothetical protein [Kiritimatiellia bacterium]HSA17814.1 hypothetical protein [Kiritimatiellia bacterium]
MKEKQRIEHIETALLAARHLPPAHEPAPDWQDGVMREIRRIAPPEGQELWTAPIETPLRWMVPACAAALVLLLGLNLYWNRTSELDRIEMVLTDPAAPPLTRALWLRSIL